MMSNVRPLVAMALAAQFVLFRGECAAVGPPSGAARSADITQIARDTYIWGMPLIQAARIRLKRTSGGAPLDTIGNDRNLAGPERRTGVAPNNDTIYSTGWFDLSDSAFLIETPDFGSRYYCFQIGLADSSSPFVFGHRTHGGRMPPLFLHGPNYRGRIPAGAIDVKSSTRYALIAGRILVRDAADLSAVHALQDKIVVRRVDLRGRPGSSGAPVQHSLEPRPAAPPEAAFLEALSGVLRDWWIRDEDRQVLSSLGRIGFDAEYRFDSSFQSPQDWAEINKGFDEARRAIDGKIGQLGRTTNGWSVNLRGATFGRDYLLRAAVAQDQIFVAPAKEAIYPVTHVDAQGSSLDGRACYRLVFRANQRPPARAFWSITLYDMDGFMVENPEHRYSIGDRTQALHVEANGDLRLGFGSHKPADVAQSNWLPAPDGPFYLMMRLYEPQDTALAGTWMPPPVKRACEGG